MKIAIEIEHEDHCADVYKLIMYLRANFGTSRVYLATEDKYAEELKIAFRLDGITPPIVK